VIVAEKDSDKNREVFSFGDGTLMQLREQAWELEGQEFGNAAPEFGTRIISPHVEPEEAATTDAGESSTAPADEETPWAENASAAHAAVATPHAAGDIATLEQKIDLLLHAVAALQRRLDSMDAAIARALLR
jgi:hypothetical protein